MRLFAFAVGVATLVILGGVIGWVIGGLLGGVADYYTPTTGVSVSAHAAPQWPSAIVGAVLAVAVGVGIYLRMKKHRPGHVA
jgi:hypothetical protein